MSSAASYDSQSVIAVGDVRKRFKGVEALRGVSLAIPAGAVTVLVGENGAGKSTLVKVLSGVTPPDSGEILVEGAPVEHWDARRALQAGVSTIYQEFTLVPEMSVMENLFLGREPSRRGLFRDKRTLQRRAEDLLGMFDLDVDPRRRVQSLGVAQRQLIEILKALADDNARVLIFDEPTAVLSDHEAASLFRHIDALRRSGVGVLYITHRLEEIPLIGNRVITMRDGAIVGEPLSQDADRRSIIERMVGGSLATSAGRKRHSPQGGRALEINDVEAIAGGPGISLSLRKGEIVTLFGLVGSGRTELLRSVIGADSPATGTVEVDGRELSPRSPRQSVEAGIGFAPEDRRAAGIVPLRGVDDNMMLSSLTALTGRSGVLIDRKRAVELSSGFAKRLRIKTPTLETPIGNLSGGNQQKAILARILAADATVVVLDEPTRGIDVGAKQEVYDLLFELAESGRAVLVASSDLDETLRISDRILVMARGRIVGECAPNSSRTDLLDLAFTNAGPDDQSTDNEQKKEGTTK